MAPEDVCTPHSNFMTCARDGTGAGARERGRATTRRISPPPPPAPRSPPGAQGERPERRRARDRVDLERARAARSFPQISLADFPAWIVVMGLQGDGSRNQAFLAQHMIWFEFVVIPMSPTSIEVARTSLRCSSSPGSGAP